MTRSNRNSLYCSGLVLMHLLPLLSGSILPNSGSAQGITISPPRIFFQIDHGNTGQQQVHIQNAGTTPIVFTSSLKDWLRDSLGTKVYQPKGSLSNSNANWIQVTPTQFTVAPGEKKDININIRVPEDAAPITNSMLFFSQINMQKPVTSTDKNGRSVALSFKLEIGVHLYNTLPSVPEIKDIEFTDMIELSSKTDTTRQMQLTIKNNGSIITDGQIRLELTNIKTGATQKLNSIPVSMFPSTTQLVRFNLPSKQPEGKYQLIAIMDCGNNSDLKVAKKEIIYE